MLVTYPTIAELGTILAVWAHPDDESWCAGGVLAAAVANGQRVVCVTATRGEAGIQNDDSLQGEPMGALREHELEQALLILGITEHQLMGYIDGQCHKVDENEAADKLAAVIKDVKPDTIITFGPDGLTGHTDHKAVSRWTDLAVERAKLDTTPRILHKVESQEYYERLGKKIDKQFNIYFMTPKPPLVAESDMSLGFKLHDGLIELKLKALRVQSSQMKQMFDGLTKAELHDMVSFEGFMTTSKPA